MISRIDKDKDYEQAIYSYSYTSFILPLHTTSLGSGSHSPFSMHVVMLGPFSSIQGVQVNVIVLPLRSGST